MKLLKQLPQAIPSVITRKTFSNERIQRLAESFGSEEKVNTALKDYLDLPSLVVLYSLLIIDRTPYTNLPLLIPEEVPPINNPENPEAEKDGREEDEAAGEILVQDITKARWNARKKRPEWRTKFTGTSSFITFLLF